MTYATIYVHSDSLTVNVRDFYRKYDAAIKNFKSDAEEFIKNNKNAEKIEFINKVDEIDSKDDGFYLKMSDEYPNRIDIYEKSTKNVGYIFNSYVTEIKKIFVFSLLALSSLPDDINLDIHVKEVARSVIPKMQLLFMEEL